MLLDGTFHYFSNKIKGFGIVTFYFFIVSFHNLKINCVKKYFLSFN
jgi:hypothetical protein